MAKLLQTNLPFAQGENVSSATFNQLVRVLEINLGSVDPDNTLQLTTAERDTLNFNIGQIIYNTSTTTLQYWDGSTFQNISSTGAVTLNITDGSSNIGIDLFSETLSLLGGTGITSTASGNGVTFAIDSTVATLTGSQTLTNKTLTSPVLNGSLSGSAFLDEDNMASNSATAVASQQSIKAYVDSQVDTVDTLAEILAVGNTTGGTDIAVSANDDITFADGSKAIFGAGSDLKIYHDASLGSIIEDVGSGALDIRTNGNRAQISKNGTEFIAKFVPDGAVELFYDNSKTFETISGGVAITGNATVSGNLTVSGTTTTIDTVNLNVKDKNIVLNYGTGDTSSNANGAGITIQDAVNSSTDATILWDSSNDEFDFSHKITTPSIQTSGASTIDELTVSNDTNLQGGLDVAGDVTIADKLGHTGDSNTFFRFPSADTVTIETAGSERLRVDSSGRLGIGTTSPNFLLDVEGTGSTLARLNSTSGSVLLQISVPDTTSICDIDFGDSGATSRGQIRYRHNGDSFAFSTAQTEALRIDSSQRVGIGTSSPSQTLDVAGNIQATGSRTISAAYDANHYMRLEGNSSGGVLKGADGGVITTLVRSYGDSYFTGGNFGIGTNSPSAKLDVSGFQRNTLGAVFQGSSNLSSGAGLEVGYNSGGSYSFMQSYDRTNSAYKGTRIIGSQIDFDIANSVKATIDSSGNVGIGTNSPDRSLVVNHASDTRVKLQENGTDAMQLQATSSEARVSALGGSTPLVFHTNGAERARIDNSGRLGIGTNAPTSRLTVKSSSTSSQDSAITVQGNANTNAIFKVGEKSADGGRLHMFDGGVEKIAFYTDGTANHISAGNFGIGISSNIDSKLHVADGTAQINIEGTSGDATLKLESTGNNYWNIFNDQSDARKLKFEDNGNGVALTIERDGDIGIGTTSPSSLLHLNSGNRDLNFILADSPSTGNAGVQLRAGASDYLGLAAGGGTGIGILIDSSNNVAIGNDTPLAKLDVTGQINIRGTTGLYLYAANGTSFRAAFHDDGTRTRLFADGNGSNAHMTFNGGNVGIGLTGTNHPSARLHVQGSGATVTSLVECTDGNQASLDLKNSEGHYRIITNGGELQIYDQTDSRQPFTIDTSGNATFSNGLTVEGTTTFNDDVSFTNDALFGDNDKAIFGAGSDLQIYHDGSNSYIDNSTADLRIRGAYVKLQGLNGENMLVGNQNGAVELYHDNSKKFETVSSGVLIPLGQSYWIGATSDAGDRGRFHASSGNLFIDWGSAGTLSFRSGSNSSANRATLDSSGNFNAIGSYQLNGTTLIDSSRNLLNLESILMPDTKRIKLGTSSDFAIYHTGYDSYLDNATGHLVIRNQANNADIVLQSDDGSGGLADYLRIDGSNTNMAVAKTMVFADSVKASFGAAEDLRIVHDGTNSTIDNYQGDLLIRQQVNDKDIIFQSDNGSGGTADYIRLDGDTGNLNLYHYGSLKLNTTSTGVNVTGAITGASITTTGASTIDELTVSNDTNLQGGLAVTDNVTIGGNLTVSGTTTTIDTTNLDVKDKNITLNYGSGDTSSNANGAGITIQDAVDASTDATILWDSTTDRFDFSHDIHLPDGAKFIAGNSADINIRHSTNSFIENYTGNLRIINYADDSDITFESDDGSGGVTPYLTIDGSASLTKFNINTKHLDNVKATFGDSADLEIYHSSGNNFINAPVGGNLILQANNVTARSVAQENMISAVANGAVSLYYDNSAKLATTSTGIDVTGSITTDDYRTDGSNVFYLTSASDWRFRKTSGSEHARLTAAGQFLINQTSSNGDILEVTGDANVFAGRLNGSTTGGQSYGLRIRAGTNSTDKGLLIENTGGTDLFAVCGDGTIDVAGTQILDSSRNLTNIGTYSGSGNISVTTASSPSLALQDTTNNVIFKSYAQDSNAFTGTTSNHTLNIGTNNTAAITINTSQNATFAGTISSGAISSSSTITATSHLISDNSGGGSVVGKTSGSNEWFVGGMTAGLGSGDGLLLYTYDSGSDIKFYVAGSHKFTMTNTGAFQVGSTTVIDSSRNLTNIGTIASGAITSSGTITSGGDVIIPDKISHTGDSDTYMQFNASNSWRVVTGDVERLKCNSNGVIVNDVSVDVDFRVESNGNANMLFVDGGNDRVGIGTSSPAHALHVVGNILSTGSVFVGDSSSDVLQALGSISVGSGSGTTVIDNALNHRGNSYVVGTTTVIDSSRNLTNINEISLASELNFTGNGNKIIDVSTKANSNNFKIRHHDPSDNSFETAIQFTAGGGAAINHAGSTKLTTTSSGVQVTGTLDVDVISNASGVVHLNDTLYFQDNSKAVFGDSSDLQIYHDGSNSRIHDNGTGGLILSASQFIVKNAAQNENMIVGTEDGAVQLYHNNVVKLATTSSGITVTGAIAETTLGTILDTSGNLTNINNVYANGYRIGSTQIVDSSRNLTNIGTYSGGGNLSTSGRITATGSRFQSTTTDNSHREYVITTGSGGGDFFLGQIEYNDAADGAITGCIYFAYDYGSSTASPKIHFSFAQRNGTARGNWWYEHDDDAGGSNNVAAVLIDDGSGGMFVWIRVGDYARIAVVAETRHGGNWTGSGSLTAGTITTGTTLFDTSNDPTSEHHIGGLFAHANSTFSGTISSGAITSSGLVTADELSVTNDSTFNGGIDATGQTITSGAITSSGTFTLSGTGTDNDSHQINFVNGACAIARDNNDLELHAYNAMVFGVSNTSYPTSTERMRIDSSGNVGIGNTSPARPLDVAGTARLSDGSSLEWGGTSANIAGSSSSNTLFFRTASTERARIDSSGRLGIGTSSPSSKLHAHHGNLALGFDAGIWSSANTSDFTVGRGAGITMQNADVYVAGMYGIREQAGWDGALAFYTHTGSSGNTFGSTFTEKMRLSSTGNLGIGTTSPSEKLSVAPDTDVSAEIGRAHIGAVGHSDYAAFSHVDKNSTGNFALMQHGSGETYLNASSGTAINFRLSNSATMRMTSTGLGIGTTSPAQKLEVAGRVRATTDPTFEVYESSSKRGGIQWDATNDYTNLFSVGGDIRFDMSGEKARINSSGSLLGGITAQVGIGGTPADANSFELSRGYLNLARDDTASAKQITFGKNGAVHSYIETGTAGLTIASSVSDDDIIFKGNDGGSAITALTLDMSAGGNATFAGDISLAQQKRINLGGLAFARMNASGNFELGDIDDDDREVKINGFAGTSQINMGDGSVAITGALSKSSGSFKIDHPLKPDTHHLVHSFVEGPQADNLYRGTITLQDGRAVIDLDEWFGMTPGTFLALNRDIQAFVSNVDDWDAVRAKIMGSQLVIECQNAESKASVSWLVVGERQDKEIYASKLTDDNGKIIVEPLKEVVE